MRIVAMVPARLGSKRIKKKNLRLIDGKPLIGNILDTLSQCKCFDGVYLNSEASIFKEVAKEYGCHFYKRPENLASDQATNDEFCNDFMKNVEGDIVIQILPTSPLITPNEIESFVTQMLDKQYDTFLVQSVWVDLNRQEQQDLFLYYIHNHLRYVRM